MKYRLRTLLSFLCALLLAASAQAETLSMNGTVTAAATREVYAPIGGTVAHVAVEAGQSVATDDVLLTLQTTKVYAEEDGTVTGVFGQPGDDAESVAERYGAVLYIEGDVLFTVSASTDNAYNATENKLVHVGETVYLECRSNSDRVGVGVISAIEGTSYTVRVQEGVLMPGDSVNVYRSADYANSAKLGRGTVSRVNPTAVTGSGGIVRLAVTDGQQVKRGDLLLETLTGSFDGLYMSGVDFLAEEAGVVKTIQPQQGDTVQKDSVIAVLYPQGSMRVEAFVPEDSRGQLRVGLPVTVELATDETKVYPGVISMLSYLAEDSGSQDGGVTYKVLVDFDPDEAVHYGMNVVVSTVEEAENDASQAPVEAGRPNA